MAKSSKKISNGSTFDKTTLSFAELYLSEIISRGEVGYTLVPSKGTNVPEYYARAVEAQIDAGIEACLTDSVRAIDNLQNDDDKNLATIAILDYLKDARMSLKDVKEIYETILELNFDKSDDVVERLENPTFQPAQRNRCVMLGGSIAYRVPYEVELARRTKRAGNNNVSRVLGARNMPTKIGFYKAVLHNDAARAFKLAVELRELANAKFSCAPQIPMSAGIEPIGT